MELVLFYVITLTLVSFFSIVLTENSPTPVTISKTEEEMQLLTSAIAAQKQSPNNLESIEIMQESEGSARLPAIEVETSALVVNEEAVFSY